MKLFCSYKYYASLFLTITLSACGGNSGDSDRPQEDSPDVSATIDCQGDSALEERCILPLDSNMTVSATLAADDIQIFRVDSEAYVSVFSGSGNADVVLIDDFEQIPSVLFSGSDQFLCGSGWRFKEDICTASAIDGEMYAVVIAETDTNYSITAVTDCSTQVVNRWIYRSFQDFYLYADQVPVLNPDTFTDPAELVSTLRFDDLDPFSSLQDTATQTAFFEEGSLFGLGHYFVRDGEGALRIAEVFSESPLGRAGIKRGDIAVSLGGVSFNNMSVERYYELIGSIDNPIDSDWVFIDVDTGESKSVTVRIGVFEMNTVLHSTAFDHPEYSGLIGYIVLSNFIVPSREELDRVIAQFNDAGVTELILDLRYNGGGRSIVGRNLASQIGGTEISGSLHSQFEHNNEYSHLDYQEYFFEAFPALGLQCIIVLTTDSTASASERLINSLRPYIDVVTVGEATRGKPFRSSGRRFCGKTLNIMQTQGFNADGLSVLRGISADCHASDDLTRNYGQQSGSLEGMLSKGIDNIVYGTCDVAPALVVAKQLQVSPVPPTYKDEIFGSFVNQTAY